MPSASSPVVIATRRTSGNKSLRLISLGASILINLALLASLILSPIKFTQPFQSDERPSLVRGELEELGPRADAVPRSDSSKVKAQMPAPATTVRRQEPVARQEPLIKNAHAETIPVLQKPPQVPSKTEPETNILDLVRALMETPSNSAPSDFEYLSGVLAAKTLSQGGATDVSPLSHQTSGSEPTCRIAEKLGDAMRHDAALKAALLALPRSAQSVANVVMVWDGDWLASLSPLKEMTDLQTESQLTAAVKVQIGQVLQTSDPECTKETIIGPVFVLIEIEAETSILAFGSGMWRWGDLIVPVDTQSEADNTYFAGKTQSE